MPLKFRRPGVVDIGSVLVGTERLCLNPGAHDGGLPVVGRPATENADLQRRDDVPRPAQSAGRSAAARSRWCRIEFKGRIGWVAARYLREDDGRGR